MPDGIELAARIWLPENARHEPVPAILEYIPYRRRDMTRLRDAAMHPYFAQRGYAAVRVDMRGSGDSDGLLPDEYTPQELADGRAILNWLARQSWCTGDVGMIGISWGGFNGLQLAAQRPPELKAVIAVCATDDRYADDVHYMGGCLLGDNLSWSSTMFAYNALPPDPVMVGNRWRDLWLARLEANKPWLATWLRHPHRDEYWKHGSVNEDWEAIQCPVMAVSGWADGYSNAVFRLLAGLRVPRLGLIGPWSHKYPHQGIPGPAIAFLGEATRWWDAWLKGIDNGVMSAPQLRVWMQDSVPPFTRYQRRPGRWVGEPSWPSPNTMPLTYTLTRGGGLAEAGAAGRPAALTLQSPLSVGLFAGKWCSYAATPDLPHDQREEDGGALIFESAALAQPLEILGSPAIELELSANQAVAMIAARLSDVAPDDKATRVTYGMLNLTHRDGHEHPVPLTPGKRYRIRVPMNGCAQRFAAGHRLKLSLSTSYWPLAWPPPNPTRVTVRTGVSRLELPLRPARDDDPAVAFGPSDALPTPATRLISPPHHNWWVKRDLAADISTLEVIDDHGCFAIDEPDLAIERETLEWYSYQDDDFTSPRGETHTDWGLSREDWRVRTVAHTTLTCSPTDFHLYARLDAYESDRRIFSRNWDDEIPRRLL